MDGRPFHRLRRACAVVAASLMAAGCGSDSVIGPSSPPPSSGLCRAADYAGSTGGERIQAAVDDRRCGVVQIDAVSPDGGPAWRVTRTVVLRSSLILESTGAGPAVLESTGPDPVLRSDGQADITVRGLTLRGSLSAAFRISGSQRVTISQGTISGAAGTAIRLTGAPSADVTIDRMTFQGNGAIDVRTDTDDWNAYHARVMVLNSTMTGALYGVALQNCGDSAATGCQVRDNVMRPLAGAGGSGLDLNRSHYALVTGNTITGGGFGMTLDDTTHDRVLGNTIQGAPGTGILAANGARAANRPWLITGNQITGNVVTASGGFGLATYFVRGDAADRNEFNTWSDNRIEGNGKGGCETNTDRNTFTGNGPQVCPPQRASTSSSVGPGAASARRTPDAVLAATAPR